MSMTASTASDTAPGRGNHPKGGYTPGMFGAVESADDFASVLGVPTTSIPLVKRKRIKCKSKDCPFDAILANDGHCPAHERSWYPLKNERGGLLLGPEFLRNSHRCCDCNLPQCKSAGYFPGQGALYTKREGRNTIINTPQLFSREKKQAFVDNPDKPVYLYPWHFFHRHRARGTNGEWKLEFLRGKTYHDNERVAYPFPPRRSLVHDYIQYEHFTQSYVRPQDRWAQENTASKMPTWMADMLIIDGSANVNPRKAQLRCEIDMWKRRALFERKERDREVGELNSQLAGTKRKLEEFTSESSARILNHKEETAAWEAEKREMERQLAEATSLLEQLKEEVGRPLRYDDLYPGGILSKHVGAYTLFKTVNQNDAFLDIINYADGSVGGKLGLDLSNISFFISISICSLPPFL